MARGVSPPPIYHSYIANKRLRTGCVVNGYGCLLSYILILMKTLEHFCKIYTLKTCTMQLEHTHTACVSGYFTRKNSIIGNCISLSDTHFSQKSIAHHLLLF